MLPLCLFISYYVCPPPGYLKKSRITVIFTMHALDIGPSRKKRRTSKAEKTMEKAIDVFLTHQEEMEEKFRAQEEERWKRETELEERKRREDREHEVRMLQIITQAFHGGLPGPYDYTDYENY